MSLSDPSIAFLQSLISFPSVSSTSNVAINQWVADHLRHRGFDIHFCDYMDPLGVPKSNLLAVREPQSIPKDSTTDTQRSGVAYFCHTDVVPADDWQGPGQAFVATLTNDKLYGRGSCDMKGSLATMLAAIDQLTAAQQTAPIFVVCTADEELAFQGARYVVSHSELFRRMVQTQPLAIIGEPTSCQVVHAHKGIYVLKVRSRGRAAHSSTRDGLNANHAMIPLLDELLTIYHQTETDQSLQDRRFDPPTLSWTFGMSDSAQATNIVPAKSEAWVSLRPMPNIDGRRLAQRVQQKAIELGLEFEIKEGCEPLWIDPDDAVIKQMCRVAGYGQPKTVCYGTDGGVFSELNKRVIFGPGDIAQAHTADEFISLQQLQRGCEIFGQVLRQWCG